MRIHRHKTLIQIWIVPNEDLWIECHGNKESRDARFDRHEYGVTYLQADEEGKGHDDGSETSC